MSEEEKQAIQYLHNRRKELLEIISRDTEDTFDSAELEEEYNIRIILSLIEKQQKEIEELKNKKDFFVGTYGDLVELAKAEGTFNYISKDKIKEKIKELEEERDKYTIGNINFGLMKPDYDNKEEIIEVLQELLEE